MVQCPTSQLLSIVASQAGRGIGSTSKRGPFSNVSCYKRAILAEISSCQSTSQSSSGISTPLDVQISRCSSGNLSNPVTPRGSVQTLPCFGRQSTPTNLQTKSGSAVVRQVSSPDQAPQSLHSSVAKLKLSKSTAATDIRRSFSVGAEVAGSAHARCLSHLEKQDNEFVWTPRSSGMNPDEPQLTPRKASKDRSPQPRQAAYGSPWYWLEQKAQQAQKLQAELRELRERHEELEVLRVKDAGALADLHAANEELKQEQNALLTEKAQTQQVLKSFWKQHLEEKTEIHVQMKEVLEQLQEQHLEEKAAIYAQMQEGLDRLNEQHLKEKTDADVRHEREIEELKQEVLKMKAMVASDEAAKRKTAGAKQEDDATIKEQQVCIATMDHELGIAHARVSELERQVALMNVAAISAQEKVAVANAMCEANTKERDERILELEKQLQDSDQISSDKQKAYESWMKASTEAQKAANQRIEVLEKEVATVVEELLHVRQTRTPSSGELSDKEVVEEPAFRSYLWTEAELQRVKAALAPLPQNTDRKIYQNPGQIMS